MSDKNNVNISIQIATARYLINYRNVEHSTTGVSPAELYLGRKLRVYFDLLRPTSIQQAPKEKPASKEQQKSTKIINTTTKKRNIEFIYGDIVLARDYRNVNKATWTPATVIRKIGRQTYIVKNKDNKQWKRHLNQLLKFNSKSQPSEEESTSSNILDKNKYYKTISNSQNSLPTEVTTPEVINTTPPVQVVPRRIVRQTLSPGHHEDVQMVLRSKTNLQRN